MNNFNDICPEGNAMIEDFWFCIKCGARISQSGYCDHCFIENCLDPFEDKE